MILPIVTKFLRTRFLLPTFFVIVFFFPHNSIAIPLSDGFQYPVDPPDGSAYWLCQDFLESVDNNCNHIDWNGTHLGEDWNRGSGQTDCGDPIYAISNGTIVYAGYAGSGWGNVIIVRHVLPDGSQYESQYAHLHEIKKTSGDVVKGQQIGALGDGGGECGDGTPYSAHLHFEIRDSSCREWGEPGNGYSSNHDGWLDPSDFIDDHRDIQIMEPTVAMEYVKNHGVISDVNSPDPGSTDNKATFVHMLVGAIESVFGVQPCSGEPYSDVDSSMWYYPAVCKAFGLGLLTYDANHMNFNAADEMLRSWVMMVVEKAMKHEQLWNLPEQPLVYSASFPDIGHLSDEEQNAITMGEFYGIVNGTQGGNFEPGRGIFRYESCAVLFRMMTIPRWHSFPASADVGEHFLLLWNPVSQIAFYEGFKSRDEVFLPQALFYTGSNAQVFNSEEMRSYYYYRVRSKYRNNAYDPPEIYGGWSKSIAVNVGNAFLKGDVNNDGNIDLKDSILSLQILTSIDTDEHVCLADVNGDGKIGIEEAIYVFQKILKLR